MSSVKKHRDGSYSTKARFKLRSSETLPSLLHQRAQKHPHGIAVEQASEVGAFKPVTAAQLQHEIEDIARGLIGLGVSAGEKVSILSSTSYEWMLLDLAILTIGAVTVPIYESDSAEQIQHILTDSSVVYVFTETMQQAELVKSVTAPTVRGVDAIEAGAMRTILTAGRDIDVREIERRRSRASIDDVATIIYTSGTTGIPKGVVLTHKNFVGTIESLRQVLPHIIDNTQTRLLLFLPLAHVLARFVMHGVLAGRGCLGFSPNVKRLINDLQDFQPTILLAVPRVLEKVYNAAQQKAGSGLKSTIFSWSAKQSRAMSQAQETLFGANPLLRLRHRVADKLVLSKVRAVLGPKIQYIVVGGAALVPDLGNFFRGAGITVLQGYGLSETTGPIAVQLSQDSPMGCVGAVLPGNSVKISSDGEILLKGVSVMQGYYNLPEDTHKAIVDGWFHTGDLGSVDRKGNIRITGRKKELIVTAGGKNVSPEILEETLVTHPLISHVVAVGEGRNYIGALITLDADMLPGWLKTHNLEPVDPSKAIDLPEVRASLIAAMKRTNERVSRAESIRRFRIVDTTFTVDNGYLTPSLKLRRRQVLEDFAHEVDALYADGGINVE